MFIAIAVVMVVIYVVKARHKTCSTSCNSCGRMAFDNPDVFFAPEKRDTYIAQRHHLNPVGESHLLIDDSTSKTPSNSHAAAAAAKKSKKSVTFRLDLNQSGSSSSQKQHHAGDDDDDDDDDCDDVSGASADTSV